MKTTIKIVLFFFILLLFFFAAAKNNRVMSLLAGDINTDGTVDILDFEIFAQAYGTRPGDPAHNPSADLDGDSLINSLDLSIFAENYGRRELTPASTRTPTRPPATPILSATGTRTPTPSITATGVIRSPTAAPISPSPVSSQWGIFPNCIAPAIPVEAQSWWLEKANPQPGDETSRHIHAAGCLPHARDTSGSMVSVRGTFDFVRVIMIHNSNIRLTRGDNGFPDNSGGAEFPQRFDPPLICPNRGTTCTHYSTNRINTTIRPDGLHELRWRIEGVHPDLSNNSDFVSFGTKIFIKNGGSVNSTANNPNPRGRGWYEDVEYDTAEISNYVSLFRGRTDLTVPIVSGVVPLQMNHTQSVGNNLKSRLYLDPNFHAGSHGTILYDKTGLFRGTYNLNTTSIPNGRHVLVMETSNEVSSGIHSGLLKVFLDIRN